MSSSPLVYLKHINKKLFICFIYSKWLKHQSKHNLHGHFKKIKLLWLFMIRPDPPCKLIPSDPQKVTVLGFSQFSTRVHCSTAQKGLKRASELIHSMWPGPTQTLKTSSEEKLSISSCGWAAQEDTCRAMKPERFIPAKGRLHFNFC